MDSGGIASRILQGGTAFTALIVLALGFLALTGFVSTGLGSGSRRPSSLLILAVLLIAVATLAIYLYPDQIRAILYRMNLLGAR